MGHYGIILVLLFIYYFVGRDGRIKVIGGDGIEGLLISPKQLPFKYIEVYMKHELLKTLRYCAYVIVCSIFSSEIDTPKATNSHVYIFVYILLFLSHNFLYSLSGRDNA